MANVLRFEMPVKTGLELAAIVGLDDEHAEGKPAEDLIHKANGRTLVAGVVDLEHSDTRAIIDGSELVETLCGACDPLQELHVQLQSMPGLGLLVSLPGSPNGPTLLVSRQAVHPVADQNAVHGGGRNCHLVKAPQISGDPSRSKVVALPKVNDLGNHLTGRSSRATQRYTRAVAQPRITVRLVPGAEDAARS